MHSHHIAVLLSAIVTVSMIQTDCSMVSAGELSDKKPSAPSSIQHLTRVDIQKGLLKLAQSRVPESLPNNVAQEEETPLPNQVIYVCPVCGSKTIYKRPSTEQTAPRSIAKNQTFSWAPATDTGKSRLQAENEAEDEKSNSGPWQLGEMVEHQIPACRQLTKEIRASNLSVKLDESMFCSKCTPDAKNPGLALTIFFPGEKQARRLNKVKADDLRLIAEFVGDKKVHVAPDNSATPLKDHIKRIEFLLGVDTPSQP